ncbi:RWD-containing protein [Venustampulla echinocandica]|uniref:RBR-type E3 ubiquitin transferase n=1 Tax=Venustampulla echinocandica TaxID=2656787 RepID=A0A370TJG4_9HELO|nr:RWD-containing protein [Venustampulla echinocandica]RDL35482.1 RWD-containing protein [Venustampulla echinocandica]
MEDERKVELDCITAIFPEMVLDPESPFSASIELPVNPQTPVDVAFTNASDAPPTPPQSDSSEVNVSVELTADNVDLQNVSYLPSLQLHITLPDGYPEEQPPTFKLSTTPSWLSRAYLDELESNAQALWEEAGHGAVVFGYIDSLQQAAENAFGYAGASKILEAPRDFKISMLDFDIQAKQAAFKRETFGCGICLEPKKGSVCHRMLDCGHVFCVECLQDFYNNAIKEGDLAAVRCLAPGCAKERAEAQADGSRKKPKTHLSPSELLQIPLELDTITRYVRLKHKAGLESDKNTIYCPRKWCQGAARSKKHRKPIGLALHDGSDDESGLDEEEAGTTPSRRDLLSVCEDCSFAFCNRCYQGWHGEFTICMPKTNTGELTEEDKASIEYLKLHTTPCPTCSAPAQKTHGCNHMICFTCRSHFCYLCSAWLSPSNPYAHFNTINTRCYMRLWELEHGDGDDVGVGYAGGVEEVLEEGAVEVGLEAPPLAIEFPDEPEIDPTEDANAEPPVVREALQREGPLVLRINELPPRPVLALAPAPGLARDGPGNRGPAAQNQARGRNGPRQVGGQRGGPRRRRLNPAGRQRAPPELDEIGAAQQAWIQMFVQMALNDEEDQLDSDGEEDGAWEIPVR